MSKELNIQTQTKFGEAINSGNLEAMRELVSPTVVEHDPGPTQGPGAQGYIDLFTEMRTAFPDLKASPEHITADEDTVAMAYTITGTHEGDFQGIAPTGKKIKARGVQIARFENGKMVERWGSSDELGILKQLGVEPKKHESILEKLGVS
ncbi:ester cyclase [Acidipila sp. EB88]|uniref:ester cyclase n=1 Tax=Acidipila sp. EB88 TaxID=2305226 RepID=UPI000F5DDAD9|nr:ester cyclase [Acidipila sp. EB88]RRA47983.1 ester cyclase [Acidipila sp. EB88]